MQSTSEPLAIYRRSGGEVFLRLSSRTGRTAGRRIETGSAGELDRWLARRGFLPAAPASRQRH